MAAKALAVVLRHRLVHLQCKRCAKAARVLCRQVRMGLLHFALLHCACVNAACRAAQPPTTEVLR